MRLNAFLAQAGVASRRGADDLIKSGRVKVNGRVGQLNDEVAQADIVELDNQQLKLRKSRYILLYKPAGYVTTLKDPQGRRKVTDLINIPERVVPVGRLDYDTTGALLLTNDGELAHKLMHPSFAVDKVYEAEVSGIVTEKILNMLSIGVNLEDGRTAPAQAHILQGVTLQKGRHMVELIIHEGRKHQVKRMLKSVGLPVKKLHRSQYAGLSLRGLKAGQWRELTDDEISSLKA